MAKKRTQHGRERKKTTRAPQTVERNAYDEAVRGNPPVKLDAMDTAANAKQVSRTERLFDTAARRAANDVRRRDRSAD